MTHLSGGCTAKELATLLHCSKKVLGSNPHLGSLPACMCGFSSGTQTSSHGLNTWPFGLLGSLNRPWV